MSVLLRWRRARALALLGFASVGASCGDDSVSPDKRIPARLDAIGSLSRSAVVGSAVDGGIAVQVSDASGKPVVNYAVAFAVTVGNGSTNPRVALTDANGRATTTWTLGTVLGANEVMASVTGVETSVKFQATGTPGPAATISITAQNARLAAGVDSTVLTARSLDSFGNQISPGPTLVARDPTLISVSPAGVVRALRRGASTYVVATAGSLADSILITVLAPGQGACTGVAVPLELAVGQVVTDLSGTGFCVRATTPNAEYAVIPFYNTNVPGSSIAVQIRGQGLAPLPLPSANVLSQRSSRLAPAAIPGLTPDIAFEMRMRKRERSEGPSHFEGARAAWRSRRNAVGARAALATTTAAPTVGDIVKLNVNAVNYCDNADVRTGRIAAITDRAIVVADTANPAGGFTDAEYQSFGVTFDTLVDPVDRAAFGAPTDIDNNGHVILFFTRAVNELTLGGSGVVLGYFYSRDLLPKVASTPSANCPSSNEAEVMYLMVPDTGGVVNGNKRTKAQALTFANGTVAHEYQHMINAGRRLYVNGVGQNFEERWLDEGLAHIAEDLNFWRASGRAVRSNLDAGIYSDSKATNAYATFQQNNFTRYGTYLAKTETQSPIGNDAFDDDLQTRGAIWNFLRFVADHRPIEQENQLWFNLVNSTTRGIANLTAALGSAPNALLRDWAISVYVDDNAENVDARFAQPSWDLRSALTRGGTGLPFPLVTRFLNDGSTTSVTLGGNGVSFLRFSVAANAEALLTVASGDQSIPAAVQLAVVRVK